MKKILAGILVCVLVLTLGMTTAFAHGGRGSDERGNVLLDYEGQAYLLPMMTPEMCELPQDQLREGRMFWECFYNEQASAYYRQG